jgi:hypothetical protein
MQKQIYRYQTLQRTILDGIAITSSQELTQISEPKLYSENAELRSAKFFIELSLIKYPDLKSEVKASRKLSP